MRVVGGAWSHPSRSSGGDSEVCVSQMRPSPISAEMMRLRVRGPQCGLVWTTGVHHGNLNLRGHEARGVAC